MQKTFSQLPKSTLSLVIALTTAGLCSFSALAADAPIQNTTVATIDQTKVIINGIQLDEPKVKHVIKNAIGIHFTPTGQKLFENKLIPFIQNLGINIEEGYFNAATIDAGEAKPLSQYSSDGNTQKSIEDVLKIMNDWMGISWPLLKPQVDIGEIDYELQFQRLALKTDTALLQKLGKRSGAVLTFELALKKLQFNTHHIYVRDTAEGFGKILGTVGIDKLSLSAGTNQKPLIAKLPFFVDIDSEGLLKFEAISFENNLNTTEVKVGYSSLKLPDISLTVNGHEFSLNKQAPQNFINKHLPEGIEKVKALLNDMAIKKLPEFLNKKAKDILKGKIEEITKMSAPSVSEKEIVPFLRGLQLSKIGLNQSLDLSLNFFLEDPLSPYTIVPRESKATGAPVFSRMHQDEYDLGMSLDRAIINRILQLYTGRGAFNDIDLQDQKLHMVSAPILKPMKKNEPQYDSNGDIMARLNISFRVPALKDGTLVEKLTKWISKGILKKNFRASVDVLIKIRKNTDTQELQVVLAGMDPQSLYIFDEDFYPVTGKIFKSMVYDSGRESVSKYDKDMKTTEVVLDYPVAIPTDLQGIKLEIQRLDFEPTGQLVVYLKYASKWRK